MDTSLVIARSLGILIGGLLVAHLSGETGVMRILCALIGACVGCLIGTIVATLISLLA
jgi:hypothetical protein